MRSRLRKILYDNFVPEAPEKLKLTRTGDDADGLEQYELEKIVVGTSNGLQKRGKEDEDVERELSDSSSTLVEKFKSHRHLKNRHIQLIGIGGTVGTALFVSIGSALYSGGPLSLLLAFALWCIPILCITVCAAEIVCYLPIESPFITATGIFCDEALEFMQGYNFWILECAMIPFEITGVHTIIKYWNSSHSPAIELCIQIFLYVLISVSAINVYGEVEFWLSIGKVVLAFGLMLFTFFTMVGANPHHDHYGFRNWVTPAPMVEYLSTGAAGRFQGFLACLIQASFTIAGPEYVSLTAINCGGKDIRTKILPSAFRQVFYRLTIMFIGGALCVGIVCAPHDPKLVSAIDDSRPGAAASPYVVAMANLGISVALPDIVNGALVLAAFSAGNSYTYCSSRTLLGLAKSGKAPAILAHCTRNGVPLYCVIISLAWGLLSLLELGNNSSIVLNWIVNLITSSQLINYAIMSITYASFHHFVKVTNFDRSVLPFKSWGQPYTAYFAFVCFFSMIFIQPYLLYFPSKEYWNIKTFLFSFLVLFIDVALYLGYRIFRFKRSKWKDPQQVELKKYLLEIEEYEDKYVEEERVPRNRFEAWMLKLEKMLF